MKTLVLYVFHELNDRVNSFIKNAIFLDPDIDFLVINNASEKEPILPDHVMYFKCENTGFDFGAWSKGLLYNDLYKDYTTFIFVNSSVSGPYLPSYYEGRWTDIYLNGLTDSVKLFGSTINTGSLTVLSDVERLSHVQTYIFALNCETLSFLISKDIFSLTNFSKTFQEAIVNKEIRMSRLIIENGWNIGCLMTYYKGVDFRFLASKPSDYKPFLVGDPLVSKNFSDKLFNNFYELVFIKGNRFDFNIHGINIE
jgi:hypothetical protein